MDGGVVVYPEGLIILRIAIEGDTLETTNKNGVLITTENITNKSTFNWNASPLHSMTVGAIKTSAYCLNIYLFSCKGECNVFYDSSVVYSLVEGKQLSVYTLLLSRTGIPARHENFVVGCWLSLHSGRQRITLFKHL